MHTDITFFCMCTVPGLVCPSSGEVSCWYCRINFFLKCCFYHLLQGMVEHFNVWWEISAGEDEMVNCEWWRQGKYAYVDHLFSQWSKILFWIIIWRALTHCNFLFGKWFANNKNVCQYPYCCLPFILLVN